MPTAYTVGTLMLAPVLQHLRQQGADVPTVVGAAGIELELLEDPGGRIGGAQALRLWEEASQALQDPVVGLSVAGSVTKDSFELLSQVASVSETFRQMGERIQRFYALAAPRPLYALREEGDWAWWVLPEMFPGRGCFRHLCEFSLGVGCVYTRQLAGAAFRPRRVRFDHAAAAPASTYEAFFDAPVSFEQSETGFELPSVMLDQPLSQGDAGLAKLLERYAEQSLDRIPDDTSLAQRVREQLERLLAEGEPSVDRVARALGMSTRSLQRHLSDDGCRFQDLRDDVRAREAKVLLARPELAVADVSRMLGFSEPAAFRRAFKRWTGMSPRQFRADPQDPQE